MKKSGFLILLGFLFIPEIVFAQAATPAKDTNSAPIQLDLASALSLAEKNSFSLQGSQADLESKRTAAQTSWSLFYPTASLSTTLGTGTTDPATPVNTLNRLSVSLDAGITYSPTLAFDVKRLWNNYEAGLATYEQAKATLASNIKKYYFSLLFQTQQIGLLQKQTDAAKARFDAADFKYTHGFLSEIDKLTVEYAYKDKLYALETAQNAFVVNLRQLKDICGIAGETEVKLTGSIPDISSIAVDPARASIGRNPDLKLLDLNKTQAEIQRDQDVAAMLPTISLGGKISGGYSTDPFTSPLFNASSWSWGSSAALSLTVTVPLDAYLPYSQTQASLSLANAAVAKLAYSILDQTQSAKRQANTLILTLKQIQSQIDSLQVNITMAERNLSLTEQLYNSGKKSFLDLKDAENSLYEAQVQFINAKNNYLSAVLNLEYLYNADFGL
jgi:outer membrane protein TolC